MGKMVSFKIDSCCRMSAEHIFDVINIENSGDNFFSQLTGNKSHNLAIYSCNCYYEEHELQVRWIIFGIKKKIKV